METDFCEEKDNHEFQIFPNRKQEKGHSNEPQTLFCKKQPQLSLKSITGKELQLKLDNKFILFYVHVAISTNLIPIFTSVSNLHESS